MATIFKVRRKDGKLTYRAQIRRAGYRSLSATFDKRADASAWAREMDNGVRLAKRYGGCAYAQIHSVATLIEDYCDRKGESLIDAKNARLAWWHRELGSKKLCDLTRADIREGLRILASTDAFRGGWGLRGGKPIAGQPAGKRRSAATLNRYQSAIGAALQYACDEEYLTENVARGIKRKPEDNERTRWLRPKERDRLLRACRCESEDLYALVLLALSTGGRLSELLMLRWGDIDLEAQVAFLATSKNSDPRCLPLRGPIHDVLTERIKVRFIECDLVFPNRTRPNKPFGFRCAWDRALVRAAVEDFHFHDLRHSTASYLSQAGVSAFQIAQILGHRSIATTKRYSHHDTASASAALEHVTSNLFG